MKRLVTAAALAALSIPASAYAGDWTGAYLGAGVGSTKADTQNLDDSDAVYSLHGGYDYDMGEWVLGGELEYSDTNIGVPSVGTIDQIGRFKVRAGYDFGQVMGYFLAGVTRAETDFGNDNGMNYGGSDALQTVARIGRRFPRGARFSLMVWRLGAYIHMLNLECDCRDRA